MYITKRYQFISDEQFWDLLSKREQADHAAQINASMIDTTNLVKVNVWNPKTGLDLQKKLRFSQKLLQDDEGQMSLDECKRQILRNLQVLERHGYVSIKVSKKIKLMEIWFVYV